MDDGQLVLVLVHGTLQQRLGQAVNIDWAANLVHHAAKVDGEAGLAHAQPVLGQCHAFTTAFGHFAVHDGDATHGVHEVELHLIALALAQVHRLHDGHGGARLIGDGACSFLDLGHLARQAVDVARARLGADEHPHRLLDKFFAVISRRLRFHGVSYVVTRFG